MAKPECPTCGESRKFKSGRYMCSACNKRRLAKWRLENRDKHRASSRRWYNEHREQVLAKKAAEYTIDPTPVIARKHLRKARMLAAVCVHGNLCVSAELLKEIAAGHCFYCGAQAQEADHFYPLARGGLHCKDNLVPACFACNRSKYAHDPYEWMASRATKE